MPAKAIPLIVAAVVATGIVIYNHREQIVDLYERGRDKLAQSLHRFADTVGPRQREAPVGYSDYNDTTQRRHSFDERVAREEEAEGFLQPYRTPSHRATGRAQNTPARYRHRQHNGEESQGGQVFYDLQSSGIPLERVCSRQAVVEKELPPPPLPPRRHSEGQPLNEPAPSESGYGSEHTVVVSPPIKATKYQPSPLAQTSEQSQTVSPVRAPVAGPAPVEQSEGSSRSASFVPLAAAVAVGATAGVTAATLTPPIIPSAPLSTSTLAPVQNPPSIHSSSHSEPDAIPQNPFETTASYMSTQQWINNTSGSDDSRPPTPNGISESGSITGEIVDIPDVVSEFGTASDGEFDDAASWTELGSQTSENDY